MKKLIVERMYELLNLSKDAFKKGDIDLAKRYIYIIKKYSEKNKVRIPKEIRLSFCKKCLTPWIPNRTLKVRLSRRGKYLIYTCKSCGYTKRIPYKKFKKGTN